MDVTLTQTSDGMNRARFRYGALEEDLGEWMAEIITAIITSKD
jgi:hypothetical protein